MLTLDARPLILLASCALETLALDTDFSCCADVAEYAALDSSDPVENGDVRPVIAVSRDGKSWRTVSDAAYVPTG